MKSQLVLVLLAFFGVLAVTSQMQGQVYCGRRLATALDLVCDGNLIKRSPSYRSTGGVGNAGGWPRISAHRAHSMGRAKRQVVSECCEKPCTIDELMSYCSY